MSTLYRTFKTFLYRAIPNSYKSTNPNEFVLSQDLVTVFKTTDQDQVYENRNVSLNQLAGMIGGGSQGLVGPQGPQGPAGPAVPSGLNWLGEYNSGTAYELNDVVTWTNPDTDILGSYWVTDEEGISGVAPTNNSGVINAGWAFLASQGAQGLQGVKGDQGPVGPQGPAGAGIKYQESAFTMVLIADGNTGSFMDPATMSKTFYIDQLDLANDLEIYYSQGSDQQFLITYPSLDSGTLLYCKAEVSLNPTNLPQSSTPLLEGVYITLVRTMSASTGYLDFTMLRFNQDDGVWEKFAPNPGENFTLDVSIKTYIA